MAFISHILTYRFLLTAGFCLWMSPTVLRHWKLYFTSKSVLQSKCRATGVWCDRFVAENVICIFFSTRYRKWRLCKCVCVERIFHLKLVAFYFNYQNYEVILGLRWLFRSKYCRCLYFLWCNYLIYSTSIILAVHTVENTKCLCF